MGRSESIPTFLFRKPRGANLNRGPPTMTMASLARMYVEKVHAPMVTVQVQQVPARTIGKVRNTRLKKKSISEYG